MKVLVIGSGGREHTLVWKIAQSPMVKKIFCAPGNAGIKKIATCIPIESENVEALQVFAEKEAIDLTVVGPEAPLAMGIVDRFEAAGLRVFGATQKAAEIESSKAFAKDLMNKYNIPTAKGDVFQNYAAAQKYIRKIGAPVVVKADGLAAGKGVIVCATIKEALSALKLIMKDRAFGDAGKRVVIEACLVGEEVSFLAFTDGKTVLPLPTSQDHKAAYNGDKGPNTGGMGAYSPAPIVDRFLHDRIMQEVMLPTVQAMAAEGRPYKGVLYAGLMINRDQINVLEFNGRFGDPEAQPLLMRVKSDIVPIMEAIIDERLDQCELDIDTRAAMCVVLASGGYPGKYKKGMPITGLDKAQRFKDVVVFHAGTSQKGKQIVTNGGRVLGVTALGDTIEQAIQRAYQAVNKIQWNKVHYRNDIGQKALRRMETAPKVLIVMGSDSDLPTMTSSISIFKKFGIPFEITVASAHRSPARAVALATGAHERGIKVIIAGAGHAAHLGGVLAAHTTLPIIGVPIGSSCLQGMDALLSTVQMPPGVPVATVSIGKPGAKNAAILAVQMLALSDEGLQKELTEEKKAMAAQVEAKAKKLAV
jgi:phosphoribosylamine---glycine ligase